MLNLTLTLEQIQTIADALVEMPFKKSASLIAEITKQVNEQQKPRIVETEPDQDAA